MTVTPTTLTARDGLQLFLRIWEPDAAPQRVLILVHGLGEHAGRYPHVVAAFLARNYIVYGHDHRGFGRSAGRRGDCAAFDQLLTDLDQVVELARRRHPGLPAGMYAHSLGGLIGTHYLARFGHKIAAAVLSAPGYGVGPDFSRATLMAVRILSRLAPRLTVSTGGGKDFRLSHDPAVKRAYEEDPLRHDLVTLRFARTNLQKAVEAQALLPRLTLPVRVILGEDDTTINRQAILDAVAAAGPNVTFRSYPACMHELHNELPELHDPVLAETAQWMDEVLSALPSTQAAQESA